MRGLMLAIVTACGISSPPAEAILGGVWIPQESCEKPLTAKSVIKDLLREREEKLRAEEAARRAPPEPELPPKSAEEIQADIAAKFAALPPMALAVIGEKVTPVACDTACAPLSKVRTFFSKLREIFYERDSLLGILEAAFIGKSSVLILGPGGTAKSDVADRAGENIVEEDGSTSYFSLQLTQDTTASETQGGVIVEEALKGRQIRNWMEGVLGSKIVFLDEFFDGRLKFLRSFLKAFNERVYTQGKVREAGLTEVFIAASNKYLNQIYEMFGNNDPQALIDRFQYIYYAPGVLHDTASILGLARMNRPDIPKLTFNELKQVHEFAASIPIGQLEVLRAQAIFTAMRRKVREQEALTFAAYAKAKARNERVQPPYKSTRVFSPRSLRMSFKLIQVRALARMQESESTIAVSPEDVDRLMSTYLGMQTDKLSQMEEGEDVDPYEKAQLETLRFEHDAISEVLNSLMHEEADNDTEVERIVEKLKSAGTDEDIRIARSQLYDFVDELSERVEEIQDAEKIDARMVTALYALRRLATDPVTGPLLTK